MQNQDVGESPNDAEESNDQSVTDGVEFQPIHIAGSMSLSDSFHANRLITRAFWPRVFLVLLVLAAYITFFSAIALSARSYSQESSNRILLAVILFPLILAAFYICARFNLWRKSREKKGFFAETEATITEDGIKTNPKQYDAYSFMSWSVFTDFRRSDRMAALLHSKEGGYLFVSRKKFLTERDWGRFIELLQQKLNERT